MTLRPSSPRIKRRWLGLAAVVIAVTALAGGAALAVHDVGEFELDKNASNDTNVTRFGVLGSNVNATTTTIPICRTAAQPGFPFTILVKAERMSVTGVAGGSFGGSCSGTKVNYTVTRAFNGTTAASHMKSGVSGFVSLIVSQAKDGPDWDQVYAAIQADPDSSCDALGLVECTFIHDGIGPSTFTVGSTKDHLPIAGWFHTSGASPDKGEILNAYAAKAIDDDDDQLLYFGMDRYAVDGSTDIGFWFFQDQIVACPDPTAPADACDGVPNGKFAGEHIEGDILILGTFTQGGASSDIRVFRWVDSGGNEQDHIQGPTGAFGDCVPAPLGDNGCATVNDTTIEVPWNYTFKGASTGGWIPTGGAFEGGVNLTAIGLEGCFSSFLAETRSSPEITAILKDFALGEFEACDTEVVTTPSDSGGTALTDSDSDSLPDIEIGTGASGVDVTDAADVTITGIPEWDGTLTFFICGPIATGTCATGGLEADSQSIDETTTQPIVSASVNLTEVGRYCWRAEFASATDGVPDGEDASEGECFEVLPVQPQLSTTAWSTGDSSGSAQTDPVSFGDPLYDKATLSGTAYQPGTDGPNTTYPSINATMDTPANGSITFTLIGPDDCATTATGTGTNPETGVSVSGDDDYFSSGFTPDAPGDYHWQATYSGSSPNTLSASHNDECDEPAEDVTVQQLQPTMSTAQTFIPNDSATVSVGAGAGALDGSVTFYLWIDDNTCGSDDLATADQSFGPFDVDAADDGSDPLTDTVSTDNSTAYGDSGTTFHWIVVFESDNSAHLGVTSGCGNEHSSITIDNGDTVPTSP